MYTATLRWIDYFLSKYSTNKIHKGILLCYLHYITYGVFIMYVLFGPINTIFYLIIILLIMTYISHLLFRGCIILKAERMYFDKSWKGLFHSLNIFGIYPTDYSIKQYYSSYLIYFYLVAITARLYLYP